jgi:acetolactate synthase regulatory subunit
MFVSVSKAFLICYFFIDGSTSPGSKMQIEMDVTSSRSSLSFDTYNYQYTRGIDVQQVTIRNCYVCRTYPNSVYEFKQQ